MEIRWVTFSRPSDQLITEKEEDIVSIVDGSLRYGCVAEAE